MRAQGYEVASFGSAEEYLGSTPPTGRGCLVLDVQLPGMSGLDLQSALAERAQPPPIVFITAHDDREAECQARRGGALAFLRKPFDDSELLAALHEAFADNT
jgi:FixJ family two-component response regulator